MKCFNFRTLLDDKIFGEGFFACPDFVNEKLGVTVCQSELTDFTYSDPAVGSFNLSNLHAFRLIIGAIPSDCFFSIVMSEPNGLDAIVSSFVQPSILGVVAGKSIKIEWPTSCPAILVQESVFPNGNSEEISSTTKLKENIMNDANTVVTLTSPSGYFLLRSKLNGFVLNIRDSNKIAGASLVAAPVVSEHGTANQQWETTLDGLIRSRLNNFVVDITDSNKAAGTPVISYPVNGAQGSSNQRWKLTLVPGTNYFLIKSDLNGFVLDVKESNQAANASVISHPINGEHGTSNQHWEFIPVPVAALGAETVVGTGQAQTTPAKTDGANTTSSQIESSRVDNTTGWRVEKHVRLLADLTGNKCADIVGFGDSGVWVALNKGDGTFTPPNQVIAGYAYNAGGFRVESHPRVLADLTGDGRADIVGFGNSGVWVALNKGDGTFHPSKMVVENFGYSAGGWRVEHHLRFVTDLTGNKCADIVGFGGAGVWVSFNNGDGSFQAPKQMLANFGHADGWRVEKHPRFLADLTGDSRADIVGFADDGVWIALNNGNGTFQAAKRVLTQFGYNDGWRVEKHPRFLADLTGDGCADIVGFADDGAWVAFNNGDGTFQTPRHVVKNYGYTAGGWRVESHPRFVTDLTGDGRTDIIGFGNAGAWLSLNNVDGTFQAPQGGIRHFGHNAGEWRVEKHPRFLVDLTGDGRADIIGFGNEGVWVSLNNGKGVFQAQQMVLPYFGYNGEQASNQATAQHATGAIPVKPLPVDDGQKTTQLLVVETVNANTHPAIPAGSKASFMPSAESLEQSATCQVIKFNGLTYWAYSYDDNRVGMNIVAYDAANKVVKQWEKTGARYLWKITADTANQTVTFHGQASQTITMKWSELALNTSKSVNIPLVETVNVNTHPSIPEGLTGSFSPAPDRLDQSATCNVIKFNGLTYWAYSYRDNRVGMNIVAYDAANKVVKQWEKTGARYLWKITVDEAAQTVVFHGQSSQTITMKWSELAAQTSQVNMSITIETVNASAHPAIPAGSKASFMPSADSLEQSATCQVIKFNGLTYWAYSYDDNRVGMNIVAYDAANKVVKQWEKTGARYLWKITADVTNQTVTFYGQASQTITMKWSELAVV
jgi:hypothetical protein